jgi:hypothetical protein
VVCWLVSTPLLSERLSARINSAADVQLICNLIYVGIQQLWAVSMHSVRNLLLSQCLQRCRSHVASESRLFSAGSSGITDDPFVAPQSEALPSGMVQLGDAHDATGTHSAEEPSRRWFAKRHNAPARQEMYHRRCFGPTSWPWFSSAVGTHHLMVNLQASGAEEA